MHPTIHRYALVCLSAAALLSGARTSHAAVIEGSRADYEPRLVRPTGSNPGEQFAIDPAVDTPSDANNLRIGGQTRFRIGSAYFFALPTLQPGELVSTAGLRFSQLPDSATNGVVPTFNADLRVLGITQDISVANDPDSPPVAETVNPAISSLLYNDAATDDRAGIGTALPRLLLQDDFLTPAQYLANGGTAAVRETSILAGTTLAGYLNALYASGVPDGSFLIVTLNPDAPPDDTLTNRYQIASANAADAAQRPALTIDVVPEPSAMGVLAVAAVAVLRRRRA